MARGCKKLPSTPQHTKRFRLLHAQLSSPPFSSSQRKTGFTSRLSMRISSLITSVVASRSRLLFSRWWSRRSRKGRKGQKQEWRKEASQSEEGMVWHQSLFQDQPRCSRSSWRMESTWKLWGTGRGYIECQRCGGTVEERADRLVSSCVLAFWDCKIQLLPLSRISIWHCYMSWYWFLPIGQEKQLNLRLFKAPSY